MEKKLLSKDAGKKDKKMTGLSCNRGANKVTAGGGVELSLLQALTNSFSRLSSAVIRQKTPPQSGSGDLPKTPSYSLLQFHLVSVKHRALIQLQTFFLNMYTCKNLIIHRWRVRKNNWVFLEWSVLNQMLNCIMKLYLGEHITKIFF